MVSNTKARASRGRLQMPDARFRSAIAWKHLARDAFSTHTDENAAMAKKEAKKLDELFHDTLKDIYFAEKKIPSPRSRRWRRRRKRPS